MPRQKAATDVIVSTGCSSSVMATTRRLSHTGCARAIGAGAYTLRKKEGRQNRPSRTAFRAAYQALTSGTFGTEPPFGPEFLGGFGLRGARGFAVRCAGTFSGFGVTGPSRYSKPSVSLPCSSLVRITRTWPPFFSLP